MADEVTFTIREVSEGIALALKRAFSDKLWVVGEIQGLDRSKHGKHWYFQLCETDGDGEVFRLSATIWNRTRDRLFGPKGRLNGVIDAAQPLDGTKIRALCRLDFYAPYGKISLHVEDIDPTYTLGDLEARRQALIEKLTKLGTLHDNAGLELEEVPIRLGLITSDGSAAYNDFMNELKCSEIGFSVALCDARMQGEETVPTVRAALSTLERRGVDAIVIIRGGGSRLDLSWFDREEVVQEIVRCSKPVITGIGHEIDVTVSEMAAHTGLKTPTAAAAFLVERVKAYLDTVTELGRGVGRAALTRTGSEEMLFRNVAGRFVGGVKLMLAEAFALIRDAPRRLVQLAQLATERQGSALAGLAGRLVAGRHVRRFEDLRIELSEIVLRLSHVFRERTGKEGHRIDLWTERLRLLDPARTLDRGYALLRDERGKNVKSVDGLKKGDRFLAVISDGRVAATVEKTEKEENNGGKEKRQLEIW
jgi:exodeoxyribonuclease VII large subunit